jgi:hypothetical protein
MNFEVDYSMDRLIFTFSYGQDKKISWLVDKPYVTSYPNFQKMNKNDLHIYYTHSILPQMREYFNFMTFNNMSFDSHNDKLRR